ncbi:hypothetical protein KSP40_PGU001422 [Platanthera guangdongensis]|uniref:Uncharacterized protein n=1 Tax=Platanthera guangdongensis TaxID=2320717 RepID=A0ABR2MS10_9ASPA
MFSVQGQPSVFETTPPAHVHSPASVSFQNAWKHRVGEKLVEAPCWRSPRTWIYDGLCCYFSTQVPYNYILCIFVLLDGLSDV